MSLIGFIYFSAYAILFGLFLNFAKAKVGNGALGSALSAVY
jgi:hypothetical protein